MVFRFLLLAFIAVPLGELFVLIEVGSAIGAPLTIALCIGTAALGAALIRAQGLATLRKVQRSVDAGEVPALAMLEGAFLLVAGLCLFMPGLITDVVGFLCLLPMLRQTLINKAFVHRVNTGASPTNRSYGPNSSSEQNRPEPPRVIEGEYQRRDDP